MFLPHAVDVASGVGYDASEDAWKSESIYAVNAGVYSNQISVSTTGTELKAETTAASGRNTIAINNMSNQTVYIGEEGITASTGFPLAAGAVTSYQLNPSNHVPLYAIVSSGTATVAVQELV